MMTAETRSDDHQQFAGDATRCGELDDTAAIERKFRERRAQKGYGAPGQPHNDQPVSERRPDLEQKKNDRLISTCRDFLAKDHGDIQALIGTPDNALLVPGEGMMIPGSGGVGKTMWINQVAVSAAVGERILIWTVPRPLRTIIYQAELPALFFQKRMAALVESYRIGSTEEKVDRILDNLFIGELKRPFDLAASDGSAAKILAEDVTKYQADLVIIDPFLSFFSGDENDNGKVRQVLDRIKREVAEPLNCGLIITDHIPKYGDADKNPEQHHQMRGAGAKRDWAASVVALNRCKTPAGQHGTFIKATTDKLRYGKSPREPFTLRRDDHSYRHQLFRDSDIELHEVARLIDDQGDALTKNKLESALVDEFSVSRQDARRAIARAIDDGWISVEDGSRNSTLHNIGERYVELRKN
jgi:RecA-family ATPase